MERKEQRNFGAESRLSNLIDELLEEILVRVTSKKTANRCKVVCKRWYSILSSRQFTARCNSFHRRRDSFALLFQWGTTVRFSDHGENHLSVHDLKLDFLGTSPADDGDLRVEASCEDLLLLSCASMLYCVVNIVTGRCTFLPGASPTPAAWSRFNHGKFRSGLVLSSADDFAFKVVRVSVFKRIDIYCSRSNQWTVHVPAWYPLTGTLFVCDTPYIAHKGMLHWLDGYSLASFNPFNPVVIDYQGRLGLSRTLALPENTIYDSGVARGLGVTGRHIRMYIADHNVMHIWEVVEEEEIQWRLVLRVLVSHWLRTPGCNFLAFHPFDGDVLFFVTDYCYVIWTNLQTGLSKTCKQFTPRRTNPWPTAVFPPLLHHWLPTPLASPLPDSSSFVCGVMLR